MYDRAIVVSLHFAGPWALRCADEGGRRGGGVVTRSSPQTGPLTAPAAHTWPSSCFRTHTHMHDSCFDALSFSLSLSCRRRCFPGVGFSWEKRRAFPKTLLLFSLAEGTERGALGESEIRSEMKAKRREVIEGSRK